VSGVWRAPPPGRGWVAGYWLATQGGWQRIPGYWAMETQEVVEYLPEPPPLIESGPSLPAPAVDSVYVPGCWGWSVTRYRWPPGFWMEPRPGWVFVPAHYEWTPVGFVFLDGYW